MSTAAIDLFSAAATDSTVNTDAVATVGAERSSHKSLFCMSPQATRRAFNFSKRISGCLHGRMGSLGQDPGSVFAVSNRNPFDEKKHVDVTNRDETRMRRECSAASYHACA